MKMKKVLFVGVALLLSTSLCLPVAFAQPGTQNAGNPKMADTHKHPEIHQAMHDLENAKHHLEQAQHDFGGHRVKAIEHINQAMDELKEALKSAESEGR